MGGEPTTSGGSGAATSPTPVIASVRVDAAPEVADALARIGRTEDVCFSPDGRRIAISAFDADAVVLVDLDLDLVGSPADGGRTTARARLTGCTRLTAPELAAPHGVAYLDANTIAVANRRGRVTVHPVPLPGGPPEVRVPTLQDDDLGGLRAPGSVRVGATHDDGPAAFVCDNWMGVVTRHRVTREDHGVRLGPGTPVVGRWLDIPDGVAISTDGAWLAVSNHNTQSVLVYRTGPDLDRTSTPVAVLLGVAFPHGLAFLPDGRHLVVADAGRPHLHVFAAGADGWSGVGFPTASHRVMDDDTFLRGRPTLQEGGPKGLDLAPDGRLLAMTSELAPLHLVVSAALLDGPGEAGPERRLDAELARLEHEAGRDAVIAEHGAQVLALEQRATDAEERAIRAEERAAAAEHRAAEAGVRAAVADRAAADATARAAAYERTLTLRLTRPARRLYGRLRRRTPPGSASGSPSTPDDEGHSP